MILIIKHVAIEGPGIINTFFKEQEFTTKVVEFENGEALPNSLEGIEAVIIFGGPMNAHEEDKYSFLRDEDTFIKDVIRRRIPLLGICLGGQLIAKAIGASIGKEDFKEIGWQKVTLTEEGKQDVLFGELSEKVDVFQWHEDKFDVPTGAVLLVESALCPQAFRLGENVYALQFHFEVTPEMIQEWAEKYTNGNEMLKNAVNVTNMIHEAHSKKEHYVQQAYVILSGFSRLIQQRVSMLH